MNKEATKQEQLVFMRDKNLFYPGVSREQDLVDYLPAGVYKITTVMRGMAPATALLKIKDKFTLPKKIFGKESHEVYSLLVDDFKSNERGTSAFLYGHKGSGKSVIAERIANHCIEAGLPVLWFDDKINFQELSSVMMLIGPCCIISEEFLKHHANLDKDGDIAGNQSNQNPLLTLLSNQDLPKFCFIMLDNSASGLNDYLVNRPDRVRWMIHHKFDRLEVFDEMIKNEPIHDLLKLYLRAYFSSFTDNDGGYDVMKMVLEKARNVPTIAEFVNKMKFWNVPKAAFPTVELYLDDVWNNRRKQAMATHEGVDLRLEKSDPNGFPIFSIKNFGSEFLDADQDNYTIDLNDLVTPEWVIEMLKEKKSRYLKINDLEFAVGINTKSDKEPTHVMEGFPFVFDVIPPATRKVEKETEK